MRGLEHHFLTTLNLVSEFGTNWPPPPPRARTLKSVDQLLSLQVVARIEARGMAPLDTSKLAWLRT